MCFKLTGPRKYALVSTENTHLHYLPFHDYSRSIFRWHISRKVLKIAFRSLQIWKFPGEDTPRSPYKPPAFGTRDNASPAPSVTKNLATALVLWIWPLAFFWRHSKDYIKNRGYVSWRACALRICQLSSITLICQNFIVFTYEFLSRTERRNLQRRFQANCIALLFWKRVWIRDILIECTERFFSGYARSSSLNFVVMNKILLVVLRMKKTQTLSWST